MNKKPKLTKLITTDYPTNVTFIASILGLLLSGFSYYLNPKGSPFLLIAGGLFLISLICFIYRVFYLSYLITKGRIGTGTIRQIWFHKNRGKVTFGFLYKGNAIRCSNLVMKNKKTETMSKGMNVTLVIHPKNSNKAVIKDLYD